MSEKEKTSNIKQTNEEKQKDRLSQNNTDINEISHSLYKNIIIISNVFKDMLDNILQLYLLLSSRKDLLSASSSKENDIEMNMDEEKNNDNINVEEIKVITEK